MIALDVPVTAPYRLDLTAAVLRRLSTNVVDVYDGTTYRRLLGDPASPVLASVTQPSSDALRVSLAGAGADRYDPPSVAARILGTGASLDAFYRGVRRFGWLARIAQGARGVRPPRYPSLWEAVVNAVVFQQVSIYAAAAILRRVLEAHTAAQTVDGVTLRPFVAPEAIATADPVTLRALGLSINKVTALHALARAILDGTLDEAALAELPTPELIDALCAHRGIGRWTAAVIALRGFGRLDIFPMGDSGAAAALKTLSGEPEVDLEAILSALAPQQGLLYYHLLLGRLAARGEVTLDGPAHTGR